jgi:hypothetical protein
MMILLISLAGATCHGQRKHCCITGLEASSILRSGDLDLFYGISINSHWSVCAETSIKLLDLKSLSSISEHMEDLMIEKRKIPSPSSDIIKAAVSAQFWLKETFEGFMISFGMETSASHNIGVPISIGCMCGIGKGVRLLVGYDAEILSCILEGNISGKGITFSIGYEF